MADEDIDVANITRLTWGALIGVDEIMRNCAGSFETLA